MMLVIWLMMTFNDMIMMLMMSIMIILMMPILNIRCNGEERGDSKGEDSPRALQWFHVSLMSRVGQRRRGVDT